MTKIKTSITAGIRPTSMIFHEQPTAPWVAFDFILLEAYQRLQDETCPKCGHPVWLCRSSSTDVDFEVHTAYCFAEKALKEAEDKAKPRDSRAKREEKKTWGEFRYAVPTSPQGRELPSRSEYYDSLAALNAPKDELSSAVE